MITKFLFVVSAYGIRDANAYILVFDLLCPDSFEYVSGMYSQINEGRDLGRVPVVVVGNKVTFINDVESFLVHYPPAGPVRPWDPCCNEGSFGSCFKL